MCGFWFVYVFICLFYYVTVVDVAEAGIGKVRKAWESQRKAYTSEFFELDPCLVSPLSLSLDVYMYFVEQVRIGCGYMSRV